MSRKRGHRKGKNKRKLVYGIIAIAFIFICFVTYFSLSQSSKPSGNSATSLQAAIVDQLGIREETKNETFKQTATTILDTVGFNVTYYQGGKVTVDFFRDLATHGYSLIVFRVHAAVIEKYPCLFTSELYDESKFNTPQASYYQDVRHDRLVIANLNGTYYFGIAPSFVEDSMRGTFRNTTIIMMGCDGLTYSSMAKAFVGKGAKVYIGWNGLVGADHTDQTTIRLLQSLILENRTIGEAVGQTSSDPIYNSRLRFYPDGIGSYRITYFASGLTLDLIETNTIFVKSWRLRFKLFQKLQT